MSDKKEPRTTGVLFRAEKHTMDNGVNCLLPRDTCERERVREREREKRARERGREREREREKMHCRPREAGLLFCPRTTRLLSWSYRKSKIWCPLPSAKEDV